MAITINGSANTVAGVAAGGINDNVVDNGTMADDAIGVAELSATGTASSSTFLRGDNAWAVAGGGKLLQAVEANYSTSVATTSASMVDTGLTCTINNVASGSKILVIVNQAMRQYRDRNSTNKMGFGVDLIRTPSGGSDTIILGSRKNDANYYMDFYHDGDAKNDISIRWPMIKLDTPGTTGTVVYKTQMASGKGSDDSAQIWAQGSWESQTTAPTSTITLLEIGS